MKALTLFLSITTGLLLLSQTICGFWIRSNKITEASAISFHVNFGAVTVVLALVSTIFLTLSALKKI